MMHFEELFIAVLELYRPLRFFMTATNSRYVSLKTESLFCIAKSGLGEQEDL